MLAQAKLARCCAITDDFAATFDDGGGFGPLPECALATYDQVLAVLPAALV